VDKAADSLQGQGPAMGVSWEQKPATTGPAGRLVLTAWRPETHLGREQGCLL